MRALNVSLALASLGLLACGSEPASHAPEGEVGTLQLPLTATGTAGGNFRLDPARFRVTGPGTNRTVDGAGVDMLNVDLAPGHYLIQLLDGWVLNQSSGDGFAPVAAVLQSPNPQAFEVTVGDIVDVSFRFGVGAEAIAFGQGRARVSIEVNNGCAPATWYADADGDGFGNPAATQSACTAPADHVANADDCNDNDSTANPMTPFGCPQCERNPLWRAVECTTTTWLWSSNRATATTLADAEAQRVLWSGDQHAADNQEGLCSLDGTGWVSVDRWQMTGCNASWFHIGGSFTGNCAGHDGDLIRRITLSNGGCYDYRPLPAPGPLVP